jgi:ribosomal protein S25
MKIDDKLALDRFGSLLTPKIVKVVEEGVLKYGMVSNYYLMRKLKCSESMAKMIILQFEAEKTAT